MPATATRVDPSDASSFIHHGTPVFRRVNLALFAAGVATFGLLYCVQPLMPEFSREFGVGEAASALSLSLTTGVLAFAMLFAGALSDAWGRKSVMVASVLSSSILVLLTALAPGWHTLLALRALLGLTLSGLPAVAMAYLAEEVDIASIGLGMGLYISGNAIGGMAGRFLAGVVTEWAGWRGGIAAVGALGFVAALLFWRSLPPSRHFTAQPFRPRELLGKFAGMFHDRALPWLFVEGALLLGAFVTVFNYLGYRLLAAPYGLSQAAVGSIFLVYVVGMFSSPWMGHLSGKLGRRKVLWTALALMLAGIALTMAAPLSLVLAGLVVLTFGFFGAHSIVSSWIGRRAGALRAHASSMYLFCYYTGSSIAGASGGLFYGAHGWDGVAVFVGALTLAGLLVALYLRRVAPLATVGVPPTPMSKGAMP
ncbi:MAG TPA: MFS transporter [Rhodanobacteraceae bacterium]|nr:MFS transporter [Rhodanobacteraceae bacterium]